MPQISILNSLSGIQSILEKANYSKEQTEIPNASEIFTTEHSFLLAAIAQQLGIDFKATGYTFRVNAKDGKVNIYGPYVASLDGVAHICWGNARSPLTASLVTPSVEEEKDRCYLEFDLEDSLGFALSVAMMLDKTNKADKSTLRSSLKKGELGKHLSATFVKPGKLTELEPGNYMVSSYDIGSYKGEPKYSVFIQDHGWFKANTAIARKLVDRPDINAENPAELEIGEVTETTSTGHPIVPVKFMTSADQALPVYSF